MRLDKVRARVIARGYQPNEHADKDHRRDEDKYVTATVVVQDSALNRYVHWHIIRSEESGSTQPPISDLDEVCVRQKCLSPSSVAPTLAELKDFLRFYCASSKGLLDDRRQVTSYSVNAFAESFFAGFARVTGHTFEAADRKEIYAWIRRTLTKEGVVVNKSHPKLNFSRDDLRRILTALWTMDDAFFIPERYRLQATFLIREFCWTGARIGAFFTGGLRYKDITPVLQRRPTGGWQMIYRLDQRWVKNNRDPEDVCFGSAGKGHDLSLFDNPSVFFAMALQDGALFGVESIEDLRQLTVPTSEDTLELKYNAGIGDLPIIRTCTKAGGMTMQPMKSEVFRRIFQQTLSAAGYVCRSSIHMIRRSLGKRVDELYTESVRQQTLGQTDRNVFGQSYLADCAAVDGQSAFLGESTDHSHVEYFQSLASVREEGLPRKLPAKLRHEISQDSQLIQLQDHVRKLLKDRAPKGIIKAAEIAFATYVRAIRCTALKKYQQEWMASRREQKILARGRELPSVTRSNDLVEMWYKLRPERQRLAQHMVSSTAMSFEAWWSVVEDLHSLSCRDTTVLYLPGLNPVSGCCPVDSCHCPLDNIPMWKRNLHIRDCRRNEIARTQQYLVSDVHYCSQCFEWVLGDAWTPHCAAHLQSLSSKRCGSVKHRHTLVRPAYCPFCLGDLSLPAPQRMKSWTRDNQARTHIETHVNFSQWPIFCPHPLCDHSINNVEELFFHLMDVHEVPLPVSWQLGNTKQDISVMPNTSSRKRKADFEYLNVHLSDIPETESSGKAEVVEQDVAMMPKSPARKRKPDFDIAAIELAPASSRPLLDSAASRQATVSPLSLLLSAHADKPCTLPENESASQLLEGLQLSDDDDTHVTSFEGDADPLDDRIDFSEFLRTPTPDLEDLESFHDRTERTDVSVTIPPSETVSDVQEPPESAASLDCKPELFAKTLQLKSPKRIFLRFKCPSRDTSIQ